MNRARSEQGGGIMDQITAFLPTKPALLFAALSFGISDAHAGAGGEASRLAKLGRLMGLDVRGIKQIPMYKLVKMIRSAGVDGLKRMTLRSQMQLPKTCSGQYLPCTWAMPHSRMQSAII